MTNPHILKESKGDNGCRRYAWCGEEIPINEWAFPDMQQALIDQESPHSAVVPCQDCVAVAMGILGTGATINKGIVAPYSPMALPPYEALHKLHCLLYSLQDEGCIEGTTSAFALDLAVAIACPEQRRFYFTAYGFHGTDFHKRWKGHLKPANTPDHIPAYDE